jgi:acyl dehydratase
VLHRCGGRHIRACHRRLLIAFIEQSSKFLKPVYPGDTLYPSLTIAELTPQRTTGVVTVAVTIHNQKNELVLTGEQKYLLKKRTGRSVL